MTRQQEVERTLGIRTYLDVAASWRTFDTDEYYLFTQGIRTWKLKDDLDRYARVIEQNRPDLIVEVGTKWGGSALWFAQFGVDVLTIDIDHSLIGPARDLDGGSIDGVRRITWVEGDSVHPGLVANAAVAASFYKRVMVSLDGEHAAPHVLREIAAYGPLVTPGQYLVVEDGIFDLVDQSVAHRGGARIPAEGGPLVAIWQAGLHTDPQWHRDVEVERMTERTYHPCGFFKKVGAE